MLLGAALSLPPLSASFAADAPKAAVEKGTREKLDAAQRRLEEAAREVADLSMSMSDYDMPRFTTAARPRAFLGLSMKSRGDEPTDGVELLSVSPGGAAADAGLQAGDVITELNGKSLKRDGDASPRSRLLDLMREVNPGDKLAIRYRRAGKSIAGTIVAQEPPDRVFMFNGAAPGMPGMPIAPGLPDLPRFAFMRSDGVFGSAELVALTPKLGRYFGIDKGLLVVRAPEDERLKLEEGDVIVDIDGRVPESAAHASRILASYEKGEKLHLNVLRMKQKLTLDIEVPASNPGKMPGNAPGNVLFERRLERSGFGPTVTLPGPMTMPAPAVRGTAIGIVNETV
jgi:hypothetical protein